MSQPARNDKSQQLQDELLALGSLVKELLLESVDLLRHSSLDALDRLGENLRQIHKKRLAVEMGCLSLIATRRPRHEELRFLVAMVEIAAELEHVAEHARRVARANYLVAEHARRVARANYLVADQQLGRPLASIRRLAGKVQSSLDQGLEAFVQGDLALVQEALTETQGVNALYEQTYQDLLTVMKSKPRIANQAIYLSRATYNLKRAAERAAGVCEWVVFSLTGSMGQEGPPYPQPIREAELAHDKKLVC